MLSLINAVLNILEEVPSDAEVTRWVVIGVFAFIAVCPTIMSILNYNRNKKKDNGEDMAKFESRLNSLEDSISQLNNSVNLLTLQIQQMNERLMKNEQEEDKLEKQVSNHEVKLAEHETRIKHLEESDK